jgi:V/A-type H+-transporting ATPase subunit D
MVQLKLTKTELRLQQLRLGQLQKYLPILRLKKTLLQVEVNQAQAEIEALMAEKESAEKRVDHYAILFSDRGASELFAAVKIEEVQKHYENIAGTEVPTYKKTVFQAPTYALFDTPLWLENAIEGVQALLIAEQKVKIAQEKKRLLQKELREVSIRVNLFEKIMIPRALEAIKKIKIFLGDQQLAAVSQAKVSKKKILLRELS